jgi:hypothetical protein
VPEEVLGRIIGHLTGRQEAMGTLFRDLFKQAGLDVEGDKKEERK